jgi:putative peptidoglycan lipid II flippase
MIRSFITVSSGTLASRLLGFLRDSMIAALLGAGPAADAFLVAFQLVNVVRRLVTEGALNAALVPTWLRLRANEGESAAARFAGRALATIGAVLFIVSVLVGLSMPLVMTALAPGFAGTDTLRLAVNDAQLMLPYLAFAGPIGVMLGLLSARSRFAPAAFLPLLFNVILILMMIALIVLKANSGFVAPALAATTGVAGLLQLVVLFARRREAVAAPLRVSFDADMRKFFARAVPGMVGNSAPQLLIVGGAIIASASPSAVSWLYFANRLVELPLGIVSAAMGTVLVSELSHALSDGDRGGIARAQSRALELTLGLAVPATLGLVLLSAPIVRLLFEHGAFSARDSAATSQALIWLALGLPAHMLAKALSPGFFAREDTLTPLWATLTGLVVAIVAGFLFGQSFAASGVAAGIALGAWSQTLFLIGKSTASFGFVIERATRRRICLIAAAAVLMGAMLWPCRTLPLLGPQAHGATLAAGLALLIGVGIASYFLLLALFGVTSLRATVHAVRRSRNARGLRS